MRRLMLFASACLLAASTAFAMPAFAGPTLPGVPETAPTVTPGIARPPYPVEPVPREWTTIDFLSCPDGTATTATLGLDRSERSLTVVWGEITPCAAPTSTSQFAVMAYGSDRSVTLAGHERYYTGGPSRYHALTAVPPQTVALCVVTEYHRRTTCRAITMRPLGGDYEIIPGRQIPADDPLVTIPLSVEDVKYLGPLPPRDFPDPCPQCMWTIEP